MQLVQVDHLDAVLPRRQGPFPLAGVSEVRQIRNAVRA